MEWAELAVELIRAIAWPAVAITALFALRHEIASLVSRIRSVSAGSVAIEVARSLQDARREAKELPEVPLAASHQKRERPRLEDLADLYPGAAILQKWVEIEERLRDVAAQKGISSQNKPIFAVLDKFRGQHEFNGAVWAMLNDLRTIRNHAAHPNSASASLTPDQAREFLYLGDRLLAALPAGGDTNEL